MFVATTLHRNYFNEQEKTLDSLELFQKKQIVGGVIDGVAIVALAILASLTLAGIVHILPAGSALTAKQLFLILTGSASGLLLIDLIALALYSTKKVSYLQEKNQDLQDKNQDLQDKNQAGFKNRAQLYQKYMTLVEDNSLLRKNYERLLAHFNATSEISSNEETGSPDTFV